MHSKLLAILLVAVILLSAACSTALYLPDTGNTVPGADVGQLKMGRQLYISKCSSCHTLILPAKYSHKEWQNWVDKMGDRATLSPTEKTAILKYLTKGNY